MRRFGEFLKTTAIGGLLVIVPIAIVLFVLAQLLYGLYSVSASIIASTGLEINDAIVIAAVALASLIGLCFVTGLVVQTRVGRYVRRWFNRKVGRRIPMFSAIASLTRRFVGVEGHEFAPVEVSLHGSNAKSLGFLVEKLADGRCVVFIPSAPVATVGQVFIVAQSDVEPVTASVADTLSAVTQWGVDTHKLYAKDLKATDDTDVPH